MGDRITKKDAGIDSEVLERIVSSLDRLSKSIDGLVGNLDKSGASLPKSSCSPQESYRPQERQEENPTSMEDFFPALDIGEVEGLGD
jgi:hypothetical protein